MILFTLSLISIVAQVYGYAKNLISMQHLNLNPIYQDNWQDPNQGFLPIKNVDGHQEVQRKIEFQQEEQPQVTIYMNDGKRVKIRQILSGNMVQEMQYKINSEDRELWAGNGPVEETTHRVQEDLVYYNGPPVDIQENDLRVASIYWNVSIIKQRPEHYQTLKPLSYKDFDEYLYELELGSGTFASVYKGYHKKDHDRKPIVIKSIKDENPRSIQREISVLQTLSGVSPFIVELVDSVHNSNNSRQAKLIFSYMDCQTLDKKGYKNEYNIKEIAIYMYQLFSALNASAAQGVMHRDLKLQNIIVDDSRHLLKIIDWGVGDYYFPLKEYYTTLGTRHFRAPELVVHYRYYDYAVDVWAGGCVMAELLSSHHPFFDGNNNDDQLFKIVKFLGSSKFFEYIDKYNIQIPNADLRKKLQDLPGKKYEQFIFHYNKDRMVPLALDLLSKIFVYDHKERYTAHQVLQHQFFKEYLINDIQKENIPQK